MNIEDLESFEDPNVLFDNLIVGVNGASSFLKISTKTLYKMIKNHSIPYKKIGRQFRFYLPDLINFIRRS